MSRNVKRNRWIVIATTAVVLAVVNWAIWQKEHHLAEGEIVYLELAPVDPRSLMQGDYMVLSFALANRIRMQRAIDRHEEAGGNVMPTAANGRVIVRLDEASIAHFQRLDDGTPLGDDERRLRYRLRNGNVRFATDAFFFQEGHAERFEPARYGQFRANEQGELLLEALYDASLNRLGEMER
ncbi:GDYXXLXY domain-containing protein [Vreelandella venusta]|uniref:GDYXXLXY domain-containing protein n=1 Tax=Vreelandella venusta TaxID=44935 RepID=UPI00200C741F|nr:GDYXXLXY domain-containing protein [Halomonas venusta]MBR9923966.1 GDYXXLXY domain-containing protein [Gammaproteobacteria bacterium]MDX1357041.1 GDYXXLXY domain-containing protein [Halomonas venusta]UQI41478.1 GDYXXLXY domain-containing protein [Halomonas venusta]